MRTSNLRPEITQIFTLDPIQLDFIWQFGLSDRTGVIKLPQTVGFAPMIYFQIYHVLFTSYMFTVLLLILSRNRPVTIPLPFLATVTHRLSPLPQRFSPSMTVHDRF